MASNSRSVPTTVAANWTSSPPRTAAARWKRTSTTSKAAAPSPPVQERVHRDEGMWGVEHAGRPSHRDPGQAAALRVVPMDDVERTMRPDVAPGHAHRHKAAERAAPADGAVPPPDARRGFESPQEGAVAALGRRDQVDLAAPIGEPLHEVKHVAPHIAPAGLDDHQDL